MVTKLKSSCVQFQRTNKIKVKSATYLIGSTDQINMIRKIRKCFFYIYQHSRRFSRYNLLLSKCATDSPLTIRTKDEPLTQLQPDDSNLIIIVSLSADLTIKRQTTSALRYLILDLFYSLYWHIKQQVVYENKRKLLIPNSIDFICQISFGYAEDFKNTKSVLFK